MRAYRGRLAYGPGPGDQVFAASFLPQREIVLDQSLLTHAPDFVEILTHELFHFVWRRLPNADRASWSVLLESEKRPRHPGLSSKIAFERHNEKASSAKWKHYVCEAFCDSAAALPGRKLSAHRRRWFESLNKRRRLAV